MANFGTKVLNSAVNLDCLEMPFQPRWGLAWQYFPIVCSWSWPGIHCAPRDWPSWWCMDWTRSKWTTQLCTRSQKTCLCLAPTEFLAFPQKLQAAHYKEDSGINKRELDPEVISVLQQLLLHSPALPLDDMPAYILSCRNSWPSDPTLALHTAGMCPLLL